MFLRNLLMPGITQWALSRDRLLRLRAKAERVRKSRHAPHRVHYFHQVDDPYSAILSACISAFVQRYDIELAAHVVGPPPDSAAPDRARLIAYSRKDVQLVALRHGFDFRDPGSQPTAVAQESITRALVAAAEQGHFFEAVVPLTTALWESASMDGLDFQRLPAWAEASSEQTAAHLVAASALRKQLGHYLGATLFYEGEWYWGIDRLYHLEQRLQDLGAQRPEVSGFLFPPSADLREPVVLSDPAPIEFFFSFRSPYSAIVAPRVFELARLTGAEVRLRYVLPMVMRGLPVPREKRLYISLDAAREAFVRNTPFGRLCDPVGRPVERGLSLIPLAERTGKAQAYVLSFMQGVWAEGEDAGSDRGLRRITERAGLSWTDVKLALKNDAWRQIAEANRVEMLSLGLWGVPSFRVRDTAVWGQDRLWAVQQALLDREPVAG